MPVVRPGAAPPAKAPAKTSSGWGFLAPVGHFFGSVGRVFGNIARDVGQAGSMIGHDLITQVPAAIHNLFTPDEKDWHPQSLIAKPLLDEAIRRGKNLPTDVGNIVSHPTQALHTISGSLPGLFIPGVTTIDQLTSKAGRKQIAEHPGFAILDVLPVVGKAGKGLKAGLEAAGHVATATKIGQRAAAVTAPLRSKVSLSAARKASVLHTIGRTVHETARASLEEVLPKLKKLNDPELAELNTMLRRGEKPQVGHPLRDVYDVMEEHQLRRGEQGLTRSVPEEYKQLLKVKSLNHKPKGASQNYSERLAEGLGGLGLSDDAAEHVVRTMTQAFLDDAPNPLAAHPQFNKTWSSIYSHYRGQLRRAEASYGRLFDEPVTGGKYSYSEMKALRKEVAPGGGRGVNLGQVGRRAADDFQTAQDIRWYSQKGGQPNLNTFLHWQERNIRARHPAWSDAEVAAELNRTGQIISSGTMPEETLRYVEAVKSMPPGNFQAYLDDFHRAARAKMNERLVVPGFGPAAARNAVDDLVGSMNANILELVAKGQRPVWVPRRAKAGPLSDVAESPIPKRSAVPGSMKSSQGFSDDYVDDMGYMMVADEAADALQHTTLKVVSQLWSDTGSHSYTSKLAELRDMGFSEIEAHAIIKKRFNSFDLTADGKVNIGVADKGALLVPKEIGIHMKHMFNPSGVARFADKFLKYWMIPTLALAPAFHLNNIVGGAMMTALRTPFKNPIKLIEAAQDAFRAARTGQILDPRIPTGRGFMPMLKDFMSPKDEAIAAHLYGRGLKDAVEHWYGGPVKAANKVLEISERANQFLDEFYRNFTALSRSEFRATGKLSDEGVLAAKRLMQDYDSMIPFEREVLQRVIPFWTWKRTLVRWAVTYPMDHPIRLTVLNQMARWHEEQRDVSEWLDDFLTNALPIGEQDKKGFQKYISIRGMNPFSDFTNMATIKGWIQSSHPLIQAGAKVIGYDPFLGGVPTYSRKEEMAIDPQTGAHVRKLDPAAVGEIIPQLRALQKWLGAPAPDEDTMAGWYGWWKKYGAALRLLPSLMYINKAAEEARHREIEGLDETGTEGGGTTRP